MTLYRQPLTIEENLKSLILIPSNQTLNFPPKWTLQTIPYCNSQAECPLEYGSVTKRCNRRSWWPRGSSRRLPVPGCRSSRRWWHGSLVARCRWLDRSFRRGKGFWKLLEFWKGIRDYRSMKSWTREVKADYCDSSLIEA